MRRLSWNMCTTFAAIGAALAYLVLFSAYGFHWQLVPSAVAGLIGACVASTALGAWIHNTQLGRFLLPSLIIGIDAALVTLFCGAVAIAITLFSVDIIVGIANAPSGQSLSNALYEFVPPGARDLLWPTIGVALGFGGIPAVFLGLLYGALLRLRFDRRREDVPIVRRRWTARTMIGTVLFASLLYVFFIQAITKNLWVPKYPIDVPVAIRSCGEISLSPGTLAYCQASPCDEGQCQWDVEQDALAIFVQPPSGGDWTWHGGGIGSTQGRDVIQHNMYWVRQQTGDDINEKTPRRFQRYRLRFDGNFIEIGDQRFPFTPGMLIVIRYSWDWSISATVGSDALNGTNLTIADLQSALDESCTSRTNCEKAFKINSDN